MKNKVRVFPIVRVHHYSCQALLIYKLQHFYCFFAASWAHFNFYCLFCRKLGAFQYETIKNPSALSIDRGSASGSLADVTFGLCGGTVVRFQAYSSILRCCLNRPQRYVRLAAEVVNPLILQLSTTLFNQRIKKILSRVLKTKCFFITKNVYILRIDHNKIEIDAVTFEWCCCMTT